MVELLDAIQFSLETNNFYGALFIALTVPDICGKLENPNEKTQQRYIKWFDKYLANKYIKHVGANHEECVFLTGADLYALRCALLHEYSDDITNQKASEIINRFIFSSTLSHLLFVTNNKNGVKTLVLNANVFCRDICNAIKEWTDSNSQNISIQNRLKLTFKIHKKNSLVIS